MEKREFVCIQCPNGCHITVTEEDGRIVARGQSCLKGESFAVRETTHPTRSVTTTVRTASAAMPRLPVRTKGEIDKAKVGEAMAILRGYVQETPVSCGEVIIDDLFGCPVIATLDFDGE